MNVLTASQRAIVTNIVGSQRHALHEIVDVRRAIALELRSFLAGKTPEKDKVVGLGRRYGELDGELSYIYAEAFAAVYRSLSGEQRKALLALRGPEEKSSAQAYIYSEPMRGELELPDTDFSFFEPDTSAGKRK